MDLTFQDYIGKKNRFVVSYFLLSYPYNFRLNFFSQVEESKSLLSICSIYSSSIWCEREVWDMFGCYFIGNKFMVRLLTDYGFRGFPLRKDFPLTGFVEVFYDDYEKKIIKDLVELMQEYRVFRLTGSWPSVIKQCHN